MKESEQMMTRYLLGELSESEQSVLEKEYFTDPQFFDQMLKIENELVDDYVRGRLSKEVRERFEQSYMAHPERRERVKFAAALAGKLAHIEEVAPVGPSIWQRLRLAFFGQKPTLRFAFALVLLLVMVASVWILVERQRKHERELAQAAQEAKRREREAQQIANERGPADNGQGDTDRTAQPTPLPTASPTRSAPPFVSLALAAGGVRGGDSSSTPTLVVPQGTARVLLQLSLKDEDDDYASYNLSLQTVAGAEVLTQKDVKPIRGNIGVRFVFTVPVNKLESGDYILTLRGVGPDGSVDNLSKSLFRVEKR